MSDQRISDSFLAKLISGETATVATDSQDAMLDLCDSRAEIARLTAERQAESDCACATEQRLDALLAERAGVSEAMVERARAKHLEILIRQNGEEGVDDSDLPPEEEAEDLAYWKEVLEAALATPIPTPVDRDVIRAEAFEEAAKIADRAGEDARNIAATIRSAAKTEASR